MALYVILVFVAVLVGMGVSVKAFDTGGKRKKIFQDIYFSVEDCGGIGVIYTKTGEYSAVLKIDNPVQKYCADIDSYYDYSRLFAAIAQTLGEGYALHKQDIFTREHFSAEVATAGIFASKYLDRKALTDVSLWSSSTENYYYRRIYKLVSTKIMPKIWTVAGQMLHSPQAALYWGSYLLKICAETKSLCMQFESVVTNSKLGFSDIAFLEINPKLNQIFKLSETGSINWKTFFDDLGNVSQNFTKENLSADITKLYDLGVGLANAGTENMLNRLLAKSEFNGAILQKVSSIASVVNSSYNFYNSMDKSVGNALMSILAGKASVSQLFNLSNYNMTSWMTDYNLESVGQYYTQEWVIYKVTDSSAAYSAVFDSYSMDIDSFMRKLNTLLAEYNDNENGDVYRLDSNTKRYYSATDEKKIAGCESLIISVTCSDGATLLEGNTQYKCKNCGSTVNAHTQSCSMLTTVTDNDLSLADFDKKDTELAQQIADNNTRISNLETENESLIKLWASNAAMNSRPAIAAQIKQNEAEIADLQAENQDIENQREQLAQAKAEAGDDGGNTDDDYYRIPAIMRDCKDAYNLTWSDSGAWSGYTFTRTATTPNISGTIKFSATISIERKPSYFLGVQTHRAIVGIAWKLSADYTDTQVVDIIKFDSTQIDAEKAKEVNKRLSEVAQEYPDCQIKTEYLKQDEVQSDASTDTFHLLWSSDRLEVARQVDTRLTQIYADLVSLEKMMNYKLSIVDILNAVAPLLPQTATHSTIPGEAYARWFNIAKTHH